MRRERNKRNKIIIALVAVVFLMSVGYAAFQTGLKINGTSNIASLWDIRITNVSSGTKTGSGETAKTPTWNNLTASMEANLYEKGDAVEYEVTVENKGTFDAKLEDISFGGGGNDAIKITSSGYTKGEKLFKNSSQKIKVKVEYNPAFVGTPTNNTNEVTINLNYGQASGSNVPSTNDYLLTYDCTTNGGDSCTDNNEYIAEGKGVDLTKTGNKTGWTFVGWNTNKDATTGLPSFNMPSSNTTLYAIYRKEAIPLTANFNANGNTVGATSKTCTIPAVYNNTVQATSCTLTTPIITAPANTPTVIGYGTASSSTTPTVGSNGLLTMTSSNNKSTYYAITTKSQVTYVAIYTKGTGVSAIGSTSGSCTIPATYNGVAQVSTCSVTLPSITVAAGYTVDAWYNGSTKVGNASTAININANGTYIAKANDTIAPTTPVITNSSNGNWTSNDVKVTVTSIDTGSGIDRYEWYENGAWTARSLTTTNGVGTILYTAERNVTIQFRAIDKEGNISAVSITPVKIDKTSPTLSVSTSKTSKSITVTSNASAASGISKYEYSKDNGVTWTTSSNPYTFTGLMHNTSYNIKARVTSGVGTVATTTTTAVTTNLINPATFSSDSDGNTWTQSKTITITAACTSCMNTYSADNGATWSNFPSNSFSIKFLETRNIIAKSSDTTNTVSSTFAVTNIDSTPPGIMKINASSETPNGYLPCNGQAVSRTAYANLFAKIGTTYGAGDGSTTFNVPNLTGRVAVGKDSSTFASLGSMGGSASNTLTTANLPSHNHSLTPSGAVTSTFTGQSAATSSNGDHTHTVTAKGTVTSTFTGNSATTSSVGGGSALNNLQPYIVVNYIIKY